MKKVIALVLSVNDGGIYQALVKAIKETWGKASGELFNVLYYYGYGKDLPEPPSGSICESGDDLVIGMDPGYRHILPRTLIAYEHLLKTRTFDYIFRCCCGSYVVQDELLKFLEDKPREKFYCGREGFLDGARFASGAGHFLSKDLVRLLVDRKEEVLNHSKYNDDVAIGRFMQDNGVMIYPGARRKDNPAGVEPSQYHYHFWQKLECMYDIHKKLNRPS